MSNANVNKPLPYENEPDPSIWNPTASSIRNVDLELVFYGTEQCEPKKSWGPGIKNHHKVHYVNRGKGTIFAGDKKYAVHAGQCFVFYPDEKVYYEADELDPWCYSWVAFDGSNADFYLRRAGIERGTLVITQCDQHLLENAFEQLMHIDLADINKDLKFISLLYLILSAIMVERPTKGVKHRQNHPVIYVKNAIKFIQDNYAQEISVQELARHLALERKYFSRIFKQSIGVSPATYITNYRLLQACELLEKSDLSIGEIAVSVGYDNQFSFSRAFRKYKGTSPSEYRAEVNGATQET